MNRTFQSKVGWWYWIVIGVTSVLLFFFFWEHQVICTILCATVVIFEIEMLIHTQYVITSDGWLNVETGRFVPNASIEISQILRIRKVRSMAFWEPALSFERLEITFKSMERSVLYAFLLKIQKILSAVCSKRMKRFNFMTETNN